MASSLNRAQFLSGDFLAKGGPFRPPWSISAALSLKKRTACGDCIKACPEGVLIQGRGQYPIVDFSSGYCDFCEDCLTACKPQALIKSEPESPPWQLKAQISNKCLSINAVMCRSCGDACDARAIKFELKTGGVALPVLDSEECTGCGGCFTVCPVNAVEINVNNNIRENAA